VRKVGKVGVGKHGRVAKKFVDDVGLGRVQRARVVADVLRGEEDAEGEAVEKVARREQAGHGPQREAGAAFEEGRNVFELRNGARPEAGVPLEQRQHLVVAVHGVA